MKNMNRSGLQNCSPLFSNEDLRKLILPLLFEQALGLTIGMADTMMISSAGESAISAVSLIDMLNNLVNSVLAALATGGAVVISQYIGAKEREKACHSAKQLIVSAAVITAAVSALIILFHRQVITLFFGKIEADVMQNAIIYLIVSCFYFPFLSVFNSCAAIFRSMGNSKIPFQVSIIMNVINVTGNAIGVFVLHMGILGVAIPSLISRAVATIVLYILLKNPKHMIHLTGERFRVEWKLIKRILYIGIPSGIENGIFQLGRVIVVSIIAGFGTVQIAANGVANSLDGMGCIVGQAMNLAMITVIGRCVGAKDEEQVRYYTRKLLGITYKYTAIVNIIILGTLPWTLKLYGLSGETTKLAFVLVMIHNGMAMILWPTSFTLPNMLRACNDVRFTMVISIFSMFVFRVGFSYVFGMHLSYGAIGVWIAMVLDWIFRVCCFSGRYMQGRWRKSCTEEVA